MHVVKLATAAALSMGLATVAMAADRSPTGHSTQSQQYQAPSGSSSSGSMHENSGASGAAGTGMNSRSGATQSGPMTEDSVKSLLEAQGYTNVQDVDKKGNKFTADAKKNGKSVKLNVDAKSGQITEARK